MKIQAFALSTLLATTISHAEPAHTIHPTELHADSQSDAATVATLPQDTALEVVQRRGAWSQVKAGSQTGWVRMLNLRFDAKGGSGSTASSNPLAGIGGLLNSGRTSNSGTDTTGVRGMTEEDLKNATPNPAEFQKMQKLATTKAAAQTFGAHSKLVVNKVSYLPDPTSVEKN